jgi:hypothetical protein
MGSAAPQSLPLAQCFQESLPVLDQTLAKYKHVQASEKTTANQKIPPVLIEHPGAKWNLAGEKAIEEALGRSTALHIADLATTFTELHLTSETDVVSASMIYLIRPVLEVLHILCPDKFEVFSEASVSKEKGDQEQDNFGEEYDASYAKKRKMSSKSASKSNSSGSKGSRTTDTENCRLDMMWKVQGQTKIIAVIEFKKRAQIKDSDWDSAILPAGTSEQQIQAKAEESRDSPHETMLRSSAIWYLKQVTTYAVLTRCRNVALFNWDKLLLFQFDPAVLLDRGVNDTVDFVRSDDETTKIRLALLGWLRNAFEEAFKG